MRLLFRGTPALFLILFPFSYAFAQDAPTNTRFLVIVLDGLRPDYVTREGMPHVHALGRRGVVFKDHHAVIPTVTRVNASSFSTGSYPATHGLMGNTVYFPDVDPKPLSTSSRGNLEHVHRATGKLLTAPTLGELLEANGMKLLVVSSGSAGSAFLLNHHAAGWGIIHNSYTLPAERHDETIDVIGPEPPDASPAVARNNRIVNAYIELGLDRMAPRVTFMWLTDPDHTAHGKGMGDPVTVEALKHVDGLVRRIVEAHRQRGLSDTVNIIVTSDHGFSTHVGGANPTRLLIDKGLKESAGSDDVVIAGGAIYVNEGGRDRVAAIVAALQEIDWAGPIFTTASEDDPTLGIVPGTFSTRLLDWNHERAAHIWVSANWSDAVNEHGYAGATTQGGVAGHGSISPYDVHNTLIAAGPSFKSGMESTVPTGNVDVAPTICHVLGIDAPPSMDGRVIHEALKSGPDPVSIDVERLVHRTERDLDGSNYSAELHESVVDGTRYVDFARVTRE